MAEEFSTLWKTFHAFSMVWKIVFHTVEKSAGPAVATAMGGASAISRTGSGLYSPVSNCTVLPASITMPSPAGRSSSMSLTFRMRS